MKYYDYVLKLTEKLGKAHEENDVEKINSLSEEITKNFLHFKSENEKENFFDLCMSFLDFEDVKKLILENVKSHYGDKRITFWGVELSDYELEHKRMSYRTLSSNFQHVLCNNVPEIDFDIFDNIVCGDFYHYEYNGETITEKEKEEKIEELENLDNLTTEQENELNELQELEPIYQEIFQYYIVNDKWALERANEIVFYSSVLDCYIWGVTHWGTSWDYVGTPLRFNDNFSSII